jgi:UDP-GlcNAc:undecaprenyl-phosphate GlcNAc-1-phosphate transferase
MPWLHPDILALVVPFLVALVGTGLLRRWAPALGLMDRPDARKVHTTPTPRAGGLALFAALLLAFPWHPESFGWLPFPVLLTLAGIIVGLGFVDDVHPLPWWLRLGVQSLVATAVVWGAPSVVPVGARFLAGFWLVAMINAFNMLDNMDALSAGTAWIITLGFLLIALLRDNSNGETDGRLELLLLGALAGFLVHNFPPARIFMGDAGSTLLGFLVGVLGIELILTAAPSPILVERAAEITAFLAVVALCAVPIYDMTTVVLLRLSQGHSPFHPDKQHLSHRLTDRGWSKPAAVAWIHALGLASGACGVLLYLNPLLTSSILFLVFWLGWLSLALFEFALSRRRT